MLDAKQIAEIVRTEDEDQEVSPSTLHYYVQVGILPPAVGRGRSGYTPEHLSRFRLARHLKRQGTALAQIREQLGRMTPTEVAAELLAARKAPAIPRRLEGAAALVLREGTAMLRDDATTPYSMATEALRARSGGTPRTLRFRGGFSLQVPAGTTDDQVARLYTAIEAALNQEEETTQ